MGTHHSKTFISMAHRKMELSILSYPLDRKTSNFIEFQW